MSNEDDDGNSYVVGKGKPPKASQFPPKTSGNKRGRPLKRKPILVPNEVRRTVLRVLDEKVEMATPSGVREVTLFEAIFRRVLTGAAKGNPTQLRHSMKLIERALDERMEAHRAVWLADVLQDIEESSQGEPDADHRRLVNAQLKHIKDKF